MSLVACSECSHQVSDKAASCPHCGAPIARPLEQTVTTQATSKKFKLQEFAAVVIFIIGMVIAIVVETNGPRLFGAVLMAGSIGLYISARIRAWWHSG